MLDQELASIARFVYDNIGIKSVHYGEMPENFKTPSVYFPVPEVITRGDTTTTYAIMYSWFIKVFDISSNRAYGRTFNVLNQLKQNRNMIPIINPDGTAQDKKFRIKDPRISKLETGAMQLQIDWDSVRTYTKAQSEKARRFYVEGWREPDIYLTTEVEVAFSNVITPTLFEYDLAGTKITGQ